MSPPGRESRPTKGGAALEGQPGRLPASLQPASDETRQQPRPWVDVTGGGLLRTTVGHSSAGRCDVCGRTFAALGGAVSHARASGHTVTAAYSVTYCYEPQDAT